MSDHKVILVTQDGCNPCRRAKRILEEIRVQGSRFELREVRLDSEEGGELAVNFSILFPPAVFVDGRLVAMGKVLESELRDAIGAPAMVLR